MENADALLQQAQKLYEEEKYNEAVSLCTKIIQDDLDSKEASLLLSKSYLFTTTPFNIDENKETIFTFLANAVQQVSTFEEVFDIESRMDYAINEWENRWYKQNLDFLTKHPSLDNWGEFINTWIKGSELRLLVQFSCRNQPNIMELRDNSEKSIQEVAEELKTENDNKLTEVKKHELLYSAGCKIFNDTVKHIEENKNTSSEYLLSQSKGMINRLLLSELIISDSINKKFNKKPVPAPGSITDAEQYVTKHLKKLAEIKQYMLTVTVYPNGRPVPLFKEGQKRQEELKTVYGNIKAIDADFEIPEIIIPASGTASSESSSSSGGCYVATAVYGSYDCPEVWTLRRFRDNSLASTFTGRLFIKTYYAISPTLVKHFGDTYWFKKMWKAPLDRMVSRLQSEGVEATPYEDRQW